MSDEEREYVVEQILNKRFRYNKPEYLIKWKGYPSHESTWEPLKNCDCKEMIVEFEENLRKKQAQREKEKRTKARKSKTPASTSIKHILESSEKDDEDEDDDDNDDDVRCAKNKGSETDDDELRTTSKAATQNKSVKNKENGSTRKNVVTSDKVRKTAKDSLKPRHTNHIIESDDDDEDEDGKDEGYGVQSNKSGDEEDMVLDGQPKDDNFEPEAIIGATERAGELMFLIKWKDQNKADLVNAKIAMYTCPQTVLKFFTEQLTWKK